MELKLPDRRVVLSLCLALIGALTAVQAVAQDGDASPPAEVTELLQQLDFPGPEARFQWGWDPTAFEPLAHPVPRAFEWRLRELSRTDLPPVARARLNLELAFLNSARDASGEFDSSGRAPDPEGYAERLRKARTAYGELLAASPGHAELLTDLGDLYRLQGRPDSALVLYRQALTVDRPPARLFSRLANAETETMIGAADTEALERFRTVKRAGIDYFAGAPPEDSRYAARFHLEHARFRIDVAVVEFYADRRLNPEAWRGAGADSVFALLARVVTAENRRLTALASQTDSTLSEAFGMLGSLVTGHIYLPIAARSLLFRDQPVHEDSLALAIGVLGRERADQTAADLAYAARQLNRCEDLDPGRYERVRVEQARLALLVGNFDEAAGLWQALLSRYPDRSQYADELFTVLHIAAVVEAIEGGDRSVAARVRAAGRYEAALGRVAGRSGSADVIGLLAWSRAAQGKTDLARTDFLRATTLDTADWRGHLGLVVHSLRKLEADEAEPNLVKASVRFGEMDNTGRGVYCTTVGLLFWARGETATARNWFLRAESYDPRNDVTARALQKIGRDGGKN